MSDDVKAAMSPDGNTDNYFGGEGKADGPGHGHVTATPSGEVTYARESASNMPDSSRGDRVSVNAERQDNSSETG